MGALGVLMSIGLFSVDGSAATVPAYEITTPLFDEVRIRLNTDYYPGKQFVISSTESPNDHPYIQSASLNGKDWNRVSFTHEQLAKGGKLELRLGPKPNKSWGTGK